MKRRLPALIIIFTLFFSSLPGGLSASLGLPNQVSASIALSDPVSQADSYLSSGKKVTWDCVYFGSYPQTEIKSDNSVYRTLSASGTRWDGNNDFSYNGERYHRINSSDATYVGNDSSFYSWDSAYHYFRYEPIRWRVLKVSSSELFLLSDKLLDDQMYDTSDASGNSWETCDLRRWLGSTFLNRAFSTDQQSAILSKTLVNATTSYSDILNGSKTFGGNPTTDKVFLLSNQEVGTSSTAVSYGFVNGASVNDEGRVAKSTDYAKAMGVQIYGSDAGYWWLRSAGTSVDVSDLMTVKPDAAMAVEPTGSIPLMGFHYTSYAAGIRPALYFNRSKESFLSYAGVVCSDGSFAAGTGGESDTPVNYTITYNANGGSGAPASQTRKSGTAITLSTKKPTRAGYNFSGWALSRSAAAPDYQAGSTFSMNGDITLYAVWVSEGSGTSGTGSSAEGKKKQVITASGKTVAINSAAFNLGARSSGNGHLSYKSSASSVASVNSSGKITVKDYGKAVITITASETTSYEGTKKKITILVVPRKMVIKSVKSPGKGKLKVTWTKNKAASGYQVQFSRDSKFKTGDIYQKNFSKKYTTTKKPVTGLSSKKKYYVRVRAYKKKSGMTLYGIWSYGRMIKIK